MTLFWSKSVEKELEFSRAVATQWKLNSTVTIYDTEKRGFNATWKKVSEDVSEGLIASPNFPQNYQNHVDEVRIL